MATIKTATELLNATGKNALKRVEIYLSNDTYNRLTKGAALDGRSTKNFMEKILTNHAQKIK